MTSTSQTVDSYRLPTNVKPTHYDLTIRTDLDNFTFDGIINVSLDILKETPTIVFNSNELKIAEVSLTLVETQTELVPSTIAIDSAKERCTFTFPQALPAHSKVELKIAFEGELTRNLVGYYYSSTTTDDGKTNHYSLTQLEPTDARRAFPCWDEPLLKAAFSITLVSRADAVNLSNMPVSSETIYESGITSADFNALWISNKLSAATGKWKITRFEQTPPMSTYLVAYASGDFAYLESSYTSPISGKVRPLRIYTEPASLHLAQFALDVKRQILPIYERIFEVEYPLPKLDTLVVSDFDAGAMENWGLITGRTTAFLYDDKKGNLLAKKNVGRSVSHEVAHMWFGDITTMAWWDNLYLNEGFASLIGNIYVLDKLFPDWKLGQGFVSLNLAMALSLDAKQSSHPIEVECPDSSAIGQVFDDLSYQKGASVLRMLLNYVGEERFLKGVSIYLKKHLYANSVTRDLWEGIEEATGIDIPKMMDNWILKVGFPVVTVTETANSITIRQDRFLETGPASPEDNETIWTIPLCLLTVSKEGEVTIDKDIVLDTREKTISLDTSLPFKLNAGTFGTYRVLYSEERLAKLGEVAAQPSSPFAVEDRMGLANDAMQLARAGFTGISSPLSLYEALCRNERDHLVWSSISANLSAIVQTWYEYPNVTEPLNRLRRELFAPIVARLGYEYPADEPLSTRQLRTLSIRQAAVSGQEEVVQELRDRFAYYIETGDDSRIPADLEAITYATAVKHGGRTEWEAVKKIVLAPKNPSSKTSAMTALGRTQDMVLAEETFAYILDGAREQDYMHWFTGLRLNFKTRQWAVSKFKEHYDQIYNQGGTNFRHAFRACFSALSSQKDYDETAAFFKDKDISKFSMIYEQTLESIASQAAWINHSTENLAKWLDDHVCRMELQERRHNAF